MKVFRMFFILLFFSLFFMACSNSLGNKKVVTTTDKDAVITDKDATNNDSNTTDTSNDGITNDEDSITDTTNDSAITDGTVTNDDGVVDESPDEIPDTTTHNCDNVKCQANAHCEMVSNEPQCLCDNGFHMNTGKCITNSGIVKTGKFSLNFEGPINYANNANAGGPGGGGMPQAGDGEVSFSHLGKNITYKKGQFFPIAMYDDKDPTKPALSVMWVEKMTLGVTKFFGLIIPDKSIKPGNVTFGTSNPPTVAIFGDVNLSQKGIDVKCVRSISNIQTSKLNIKNVNKNFIKLDSNGELIDPAIAGSELKYPICEKE